jgi:hypothetical protein
MPNAVSNDTSAHERLVRFYDAFRHISSNRGPTLMSSEIITLDIRLASRMWQALSELRFLCWFQFFSGRLSAMLSLVVLLVTNGRQQMTYSVRNIFVPVYGLSRRDSQNAV